MPRGVLYQDVHQRNKGHWSTTIYWSCWQNFQPSLHGRVKVTAAAELAVQWIQFLAQQMLHFLLRFLLKYQSLFQDNIYFQCWWNHRYLNLYFRTETTCASFACDIGGSWLQSVSPQLPGKLIRNLTKVTTAKTWQKLTFILQEKCSQCYPHLNTNHV